MVQQFVVLVAGSIVVVSAYTAQAAKRAQQQEGGTAPSTVATTPGQDQDATNSAENPTDATQPTQEATAGTTAATEPAAAAQSTTASWSWSEDGTGATLVITDSSGNVVSEVAATVTSTEEPAGCRTEGRMTYTASASANGESYSDTRYETIPALGHAFSEGTEVTLEGGQTAMEYECTRCHEHFTVINSIDEE